MNIVGRKAIISNVKDNHIDFSSIDLDTVVIFDSNFSSLTAPDIQYIDISNSNFGILKNINKAEYIILTNCAIFMIDGKSMKNVISLHIEYSNISYIKNFELIGSNRADLKTIIYIDKSQSYLHEIFRGRFNFIYIETYIDLINHLYKI